MSRKPLTSMKPTTIVNFAANYPFMHMRVVIPVDFVWSIALWRVHRFVLEMGEGVGWVNNYEAKV